MKIALDLKEECRKEIADELFKRNFEISSSSFKTIWVYGLSHIDYSGKTIELNQKGSMKFYSIYLEDIEYFEIHNDKGE